jgi:hypothetical protein
MPPLVPEVQRMTHERIHRRALTALVATILAIAAARLLAAESLWFFRNGDVALSGYDAVAYFTESRAMEGTATFEATWNGARWRFISAENRDRFLQNPARYSPQFGGYCAYAVSKGYTASADPKAWSIVNEKLYVNYSMAVRQDWEKEKEARIARAEANWPKVLTK